jgi:hypothetical protein
MQYFRFEIPTNADGTRVSYSPGWHGVLDKCPSKVTVSLYNDKEGYGIAMTNDTKPLHKDLTAITKEQQEKILAEAVEEDGVYFGKSLEGRMSWLPEAEIKKVVIRNGG